MAILKTWLYLPKGRATYYHKHMASPDVHSDPIWEVWTFFCSWEGHVWVPTRVSWHYAPEAAMVRVSGTQALFWELPLGSEGLILKDHSFLTSLLSDTSWEASKKVALAPS